MGWGDITMSMLLHKMSGSNCPPPPQITPTCVLTITYYQHKQIKQLGGGEWATKVHLECVTGKHVANMIISVKYYTDWTEEFSKLLSVPVLIVRDIVIDGQARREHSFRKYVFWNENSCKLVRLQIWLWQWCWANFENISLGSVKTALMQQYAITTRTACEIWVNDRDSYVTWVYYCEFVPLRAPTHRRHRLFDTVEIDRVNDVVYACFTLLLLQFSRIW